MVYTVEFPKGDALKEYEVLSRSKTPIFLLESHLLLVETLKVRVEDIEVSSRGESSSVKEVTTPVFQNKRYKVLMIDAPPLVHQNPFQEEIVEDIIVEEEEQQTLKAKKRKFIMVYEDKPIIEFLEDQPAVKEMPR